MIREVTRTEEHPHNRLTRICDAMINTLTAHPEHDDDVKGIVLLDDGHTGGIAIHNYDSDAAALTDLVVHLAAIFEANGQKLTVIPMPGPVGQG